MEDFDHIDIEGKSLTCSGKDLNKLTTEEGCDMKMVSNFHLDGSCSDQEYEKDYEQATLCLTEEAKLERMKKEYISLKLNANKDPIKLIEQSCSSSFITKEENLENIDDPSVYSNLDDGYSKVHSPYRKLGSYEKMLSDEGHRFEEISPGRVFKRTLNAGHGPLIDGTSTVIYNCALWLEGASDPFDSSWLRHNSIVTDLSDDSILDGIRELLLTMKASEWCEALIRPEAAFGPLGVMPRIRPNATIFCLIEILKILPKDKMSLLSFNPGRAQDMGVTFDEFYSVSDEARVRGNYYLSIGQFKVAIQRYRSGIRILEALTFKNEAEEEKAKDLLLKLFNNGARAANAAKIPRLALSFCKRASLINDKNEKTHWLRMMAWSEKGHTDRALACARRALQLFPENNLFKNQLGKFTKKMRDDEKESKELFRQMGRIAVS